MINRIVNLEFTRTQQRVVNIVASAVNLFATTMIGFVLSPYVVRTIGAEANGFVALAGNFITFVGLIRTALNSMGSRFLIIAYYRGDKRKFEQYYSSLFYADLILGLALGIVGGYCVWKLEYILNVPPKLVRDVKILFSLIFFDFVIATIITVWNTATYIKNKLYLDSATFTLNAVIRLIVIFALFACLTPSVYYVGVGVMTGGLVCYSLRFCYKKNLFPELRARTSHFSFAAVWELFSSGVWNSVSSLGSVLISGLDLLIANVFIDATAMGALAIAKTVPAFISSMNSSIASAFTPSLIIDYSRNNKEEILRLIRQSTKLISIVCSIPLAFLIAYGKEFYSVWQPTQNACLLYVLSVITIGGRVFFTGSDPLFSIFTVVNKVRQNSIATIICGLCSVLITFLMVRHTKLGVFAIAGVSVCCCFFKNMLFVIPYSAKNLGLKKTAFFYTVFYSVYCNAVLCACGFAQKRFIRGESWGELFFGGIVFAVVGLVVAILVVLDRNEKKALLELIKRKMKI